MASAPDVPAAATEGAFIENPSIAMLTVTTAPPMRAAAKPSRASASPFVPFRSSTRPTKPPTTRRMATMIARWMATQAPLDAIA